MGVRLFLLSSSGFLRHEHVLFAFVLSCVSYEEGFFLGRTARLRLRVCLLLIEALTVVRRAGLSLVQVRPLLCSFAYVPKGENTSKHSQS